MSSLKKMLAILDLFSPDRPLWSAEEVIVRSGHSRPTGYRYVKELCAAGLLKRSDAGYSLGPRVIELDYYIRQSDPLLNACKPVMRRLARETGFDVLLASMYGTGFWQYTTRLESRRAMSYSDGGGRCLCSGVADPR